MQRVRVISGFVNAGMRAFLDIAIIICLSYGKSDIYSQMLYKSLVFLICGVLSLFLTANQNKLVMFAVRVIVFCRR